MPEFGDHLAGDRVPPGGPGVVDVQPGLPPGAALGLAGQPPVGLVYGQPLGLAIGHPQPDLAAERSDQPVGPDPSPRDPFHPGLVPVSSSGEGGVQPPAGRATGTRAAGPGRRG